MYMYTHTYLCTWWKISGHVLCQKHRFPLSPCKDSNYGLLSGNMTSSQDKRDRACSCVVKKQTFKGNGSSFIGIFGTRKRTPGESSVTRNGLRPRLKFTNNLRGKMDDKRDGTSISPESKVGRQVHIVFLNMWRPHE